MQSLYVCSQSDACSVAQVVADRFAGQFAGKLPALVWIEPTPVLPANGRGIVTPVLFEGPPPASLELDEARLFWASRSLHVARRYDGGCRWVEFGDEEFDGCTSLPHIELKSGLVLLRRDWDSRFGIPEHMRPQGQDVQVIEYWCGADLVQWRIVPKGGRAG